MEDKILTDKITVRIFNNEYPLKGVKNPEEILEIAKELDEKMESLKESNSYLPPDRIAVLVALEIYEKYYSLKKDYDELWNLITEYKN